MEQWLHYGTVLGGIAAFIFGVVRYFDTRTRELKNYRFDQFHRVFAWVAGRTPEGTLLTDVHQAVAVYELAQFSEYREMTIPIINYYLKKAPTESLFRSALLYAQAKLGT